MLRLLPNLLTGEEVVVYGDSDYLGADKWLESLKRNTTEKAIRYKLNCRLIVSEITPTVQRLRLNAKNTQVFRTSQSKTCLCCGKTVAPIVQDSVTRGAKAECKTQHDGCFGKPDPGWQTRSGGLIWFTLEHIFRTFLHPHLNCWYSFYRVLSRVGPVDKKESELKVDAFSSDFQRMRGQKDSSNHPF